MATTPVAHRWARLATILAAAVIALAGCGTISMTPPPATPTDFPGLAGRLNAAGIKVADWVSGESGCDDADLRKTAIRFEAAGLDQVEPVTLYLYVFRNRAAFERNRAAVAPCAAAYVTDPEAFEQVEQSPYVVTGQGPWAPGFEAALRTTLEAAAGTGG
jgi:hypothetical protein